MEREIQWFGTNFDAIETSGRRWRRVAVEAQQVFEDDGPPCDHARIVVHFPAGAGETFEQARAAAMAKVKVLLTAILASIDRTP